MKLLIKLVRISRHVSIIKNTLPKRKRAVKKFYVFRHERGRPKKYLPDVYGCHTPGRGDFTTGPT